MNEAAAQSSQRARTPIWLLVMITISGTLAMHMFVPALPDAAASLHVGSTAMQMTISVYIIGLAVGQLIYGPLSDSLGRRPMLLIGLALYTAAGLVATLATSIDVLIVARLFQALGGCAGLALGRAIVRDTAKAGEAVRALALLNLMMMVGPGFAPLLGSGLVALSGWRAIFVLLTFLGVLTLVFSWRLVPETAHPSGQFSFSKLVHDYRELLHSRSFVGFSLGGGCATTSIYAFLASAPFIFSSELHLPIHEIGLYLAMLIVGMTIGNALTRRLVLFVRVEKLLIAGNVASIVSALAFLAGVLAGGLSVSYVMACMFIYALGCGTCSPAALSKSLEVDAHLVGSAAGLYGFTQMAVGALCTFVAGFGSNPALSAGSVMVVAALLGQTGFWTAIGHQRKTGRGACSA
jgi:DHA1 family bicyclomycin/chloramphenicol resistance-like MFS transporter